MENQNLTTHPSTSCDFSHPYNQKGNRFYNFVSHILVN